MVPGDLSTRTGGYAYDRRMIAGLQARAWEVRVHALDASFPQPTAPARAHAADVLAGLPDGRLLLVDGLALGALPDWAEEAARRHRLVALVHHPLALETGLSAAQAAALRESEQRALATVHGVIVTGPATVQMLAADYGVNPERIVVVTPGTERPTSGPRASRDDVQLLCVGALVPRKGHDVLLDALATLVDRRWHLVCIGSTTRDEATARALEARSRRLGLAGRVRFAGDVDDAALQAAYAVADVFVLASHHEGYGMACAEALAYGLPVVATTAGALPDTVPADAGRLVAPGDVDALRDALARIVDDRPLRERLSAGAHRAAESLPSWDDAADALSLALTRFVGPT